MRRLVRQHTQWFPLEAACLVGPRLAILQAHGTGIRFVWRTAYAHQTGAWIRNPAQLEMLMGHADRGGPLLGRAALADLRARHGDLTTIGVWRDPVQRCEAAFAHWCVEGAPHVYAARMGIGPGCSWERFADFVAWELGKADAGAMVRELRPQRATWRRDEVDRVILPEELPAVLRAHGAPARRGVRAVRRRLPPAPPPVAARLRELYAGDEALRP